MRSAFGNKIPVVFFACSDFRAFILSILAPFRARKSMSHISFYIQNWYHNWDLCVFNWKRNFKINKHEQIITLPCEMAPKNNNSNLDFNCHRFEIQSAANNSCQGQRKNRVEHCVSVLWFVQIDWVQILNVQIVLSFEAVYDSSWKEKKTFRCHGTVWVGRKRGQSAQHYIPKSIKCAELIVASTSFYCVLE